MIYLDWRQIGVDEFGVDLDGLGRAQAAIYVDWIGLIDLDARGVPMV